MDAGSWYVVVETNHTGQEGASYAGAITETRPFRTREEALADAARLTQTYMKPKVMKEKGRWIFRTGPESWLVLTQRAMHRPYFRVWVAYLEQWLPG